MVFLKKKIDAVVRNGNLVIIFFIAFIVGIAIGVFSDSYGKQVYFVSVYDYYFRIFDASVNPLHMLFTRIFISAGFMLLFFILGMTTYTVPLEVIVVLYRGVVLGAVSTIFFGIYGANGIAVFVFVIFPQNAICTAGHIVAATLDFCDAKKKKSKPDFKGFAVNCLIGLAICIVAALYEFVVLSFIIRPISFYF